MHYSGSRGSSSCGPGPPETHPGHPAASARPRPAGRGSPFRPRSPRFAPCGHTGPPPRPARGHYTLATITPRCPPRRRRPLPPPAAPGNPPAPEPPKTASSPQHPGGVAEQGPEGADAARDGDRTAGQPRRSGPFAQARGGAEAGGLTQQLEVAIAARGPTTSWRRRPGGRSVTAAATSPRGSPTIRRTI